MSIEIGLGIWQGTFKDVPGYCGAIALRAVPEAIASHLASRTAFTVKDIAIASVVLSQLSRSDRQFHNFVRLLIDVLILDADGKSPPTLDTPHELAQSPGLRVRLPSDSSYSPQ
jgi:hypothetical protein